jgi:transposase
MTVVEEIQRENGLLREMNAAQQAEITTFQKTIDQLKQYIQQLEEHLLRDRRKQFGPSSEVLANPHPNLFDEPEAASTEMDAEDQAEKPEAELDKPASGRKRRKAFRIPPELPRVEIIHDLPESQKICPHDGTALKHIDSEIHEQLDIIPAQVQVLRHIRHTYACPCCEQHVVTASKPKQPIEKGMASPRLLAMITTQKYVDGLPLYRQEQIFERLGLELDRTTQANWMMKCGALVQPLINLIHEQMLEQSVLHMDETRVQVLDEPNRKAQSQSYMWVMRSIERPAVLFNYAPGRSGEIPKQLLEGYRGALMVDAFDGYNAVCKQNEITRLGCWAHARRGFYDAKLAYGANRTGKADEVLTLIQALYQVEREAKDKPPDERLALRQSRSVKILAQLRTWLDQHLDKTLPKSILGKAARYLDHQWPHLSHFVEDGRYPIDNNPAENAIRPFVIGRKNWLFSATPKGADASANLYSLIETAKANGLEPHAYLTHIFTHLPNAQTVVEIEALLPWAMKDKVNL